MYASHIVLLAFLTAIQISALPVPAGLEPEEGTASVSGTVTRIGTGEGLPRAVVQLTRASDTNRTLRTASRIGIAIDEKRLGRELPNRRRISR